MGSRRFNLAFALTTLAVVVALAITAGAAFDSVAQAGKGSDACKAGREQQGCKLPEGAVYRGSGSAGSVKLEVDDGYTYLTIKLPAANVTCDIGSPQALSAYPAIRGAAPKVGSSLKVVARQVEGEDTAAGTVKIASAGAAQASLDLVSEDGYCRGSIELSLKRQ